MLSILICDDDINMLDRLKHETEHVLTANSIEAGVIAHCRIDELGNDELINCDIALLDIDFKDSKKAAWISPEPSGLCGRMRGHPLLFLGFLGFVYHF